jgi:CxxC-x17-CxxC domain-containing protein
MPDQYIDRQLTCVECGGGFVFSAGEQEHHVSLGFANEPKRCQPCRAARKRRVEGDGGGSGGNRSGGSSGGQREFHVARCAQCGGEARVPFKPTGSKPVYCSSCFGATRR